MEGSSKRNLEGARRSARDIPTVSCVAEDGTVLDLVYDPAQEKTALAVWDGKAWRLEGSYPTKNRRRLVPYSATNNLIKNGVVLLPTEPQEYGGAEELVREIQQFIARYVDLSPTFERIASYYVLFSWLYDGFNEVPYLRLRGDYGSGKTRFLVTVGALCYKGIFASGASTVSPIFHILDSFGGTLLIDEGDFRFSDEKAEVVKILNNGNARGFPVLRCEVSANKEFNPRAFHVFGPKIVATRGYYDDRALESRFITEEMGQRPLRADIPISLPPIYKDEAQVLRNKLLLFRFRNLGKKLPAEHLVDRSVEPRLNQIFAPLMSVIDDRDVRESLRAMARDYHTEMTVDRGMDIEAQVLEIIRELLSGAAARRVSVKAVTRRFADLYGFDHERRVTTKWIGYIIRKSLKLKTQKSHGVFVIPLTETPRLDRLYQRYGLAATENLNGVSHEEGSAGSSLTG